MSAIKRIRVEGVGRGVGRVAGVAASGEPSARVGVLERVEHAVGVAVEALGVLWALDVLVDGEERGHHGVVHAAVHINQAEVVEMLVPREAAVEHGYIGEAAAPGIGIAEVAPRVKAQALLHRAFCVRYRGPRAEVVLEDVVCFVVAALRHHHGVDPCGTREVGEAILGGRGAVALGHELAVPHIALRAGEATHMLLHEDTLPVVAVSVAKAVGVFKDLLHVLPVRCFYFLYGAETKITFPNSYSDVNCLKYVSTSVNHKVFNDNVSFLHSFWRPSSVVYFKIW